jgi:uncharacterized protein (DUF2336 family)
MTAYRARLSETDIRRLIKGNDEDERAAVAHRLCRGIERARLDDEDRKAAQNILRLLAADAAELVRRTMAITLKQSDLIPRDLARTLAADLDTVALPLINMSPAFTDDDLIEIARAGSVMRQVAVASRPFVSRDVADVLAREAAEPAVRALAANDNADLSPQSMEIAVDRFGDHAGLIDALAWRKVLPLELAERILALASEATRDHLLAQHVMAPKTAVRLSALARERVTVDLIDEAAEQADLAEFVSILHARGVLTSSLLLRALARGRMDMVEHGLAELSATPHHRVWLMIHEAGHQGLKAVYDRAGLPRRLYAAFRAGVEVWTALQAEGRDVAAESFSARMLERFLTLRPNVNHADLAYLEQRLDCGVEGRAAA